MKEGDIMNSILTIGLIILAIAILMSMVGKGGGNFYVLAMVLVGILMHKAASTSQIIMMATAFTSMLVFNKGKIVDWKLALVIDPPTDIMAFVGGYFAGYIQATTLKLVLAIILIIVSIFMFLKVKEKPITEKRNLATGIENLENTSIQLIFG